jgi:hypothetical protein
MSHRLPILNLVSALAVAVGMSTSVFAAVAGVPETPRPGTLPGTWLVWSNDSFGGELGVNTDDYRTNSFNGGIRLSQEWVLAVDYSMMTYLQTRGSKTRSDELTATLGYRYEVPTLPETWMMAGVGARIAGNLGGESAQNAWHDIWGYDQLHVPYEDSDSAGVGYLAAGWAWRPELEHLPNVNQRLGIFLNGAALASTSGELNSALSLYLAATGRDAALWIGLRQQYNTGDTLSATAAKVADRETGTNLLLGTSAGAWFFEGSTDLASKATQGRIGFMWQRGPGISRPQIAEVEGILGLYEGYAIGIQYRWRPTWLDEMADGHASLMIDYRFGQYPGVNWSGNNVVVRQPLFGIDVAALAPRDGFMLTPFAYVGAGVREERVEITSNRARFPEDSAVRGVAQGGIGLRCHWGKLPDGERTARYGVSLVYDVWLPFSEATVSNGRETGVYQQSNDSTGLRLAATVSW